MHIEFTLPTTLNGLDAYFMGKNLRKYIKQWTQHYNAGHSVYSERYKMELKLDNPSLYTVFMLTWTSTTLPAPTVVTA